MSHVQMMHYQTKLKLYSVFHWQPVKLVESWRYMITRAKSENEPCCCIQTGGMAMEEEERLEMCGNSEGLRCIYTNMDTYSNKKAEFEARVLY